MKEDIQSKAKLILAGLAFLPAMATADSADHRIIPSIYDSPKDELPQPDHRAETTGLTQEELKEGNALLNQINRLNVVTATKVNLSEAPRIPYRYNMPDLNDLKVAREANLEKLAKLRAMIEAGL